MYGGDSLKIWLKKNFNRIVTLEQVSSCMKKGLVIPIYKRQGKDPFVVTSSRCITLSSVLSKLLEIVLLYNGYPQFLRSKASRSAVYNCLSISCRAWIYYYIIPSLQCKNPMEATLPVFVFIEKAFDLVELPIRLKQLHDIGINGKSWRLIKNCY